MSVRPLPAPLAGLLHRATSGIPHLGQLLSAQGFPLAMVGCVNVALVFALTPPERGRTAAIVTAGSLIASIAFLDLHLGVVARFRQGDLEAPVRGLLVIICVSVTSLLLAAVALTVPTFSLGSISANDLAIGLTGAALSVVALYSGRVLQAVQGPSAYLAVSVGQAGAYLSVVVALVALGQLGSTSAALAWVGGAGTAALLGIWGMRQLPHSPQRFRQQGSGLVRSSMSGHSAACAYQLLYRSDLLILAVLGSATDVGQYALAVAVAEVIWQVAEAVALSTYAEGARSLGQADRAARLVAHVRAYRRIAVPLAMLALAGLAVIVTVLLPAYRPSIPLLLVLLPGVLAGGELRIRLGSLNADAGAGRAIRALAILAALSCLVYIPSIAAFGAVGAAAATTAVYALNGVAARRRTSFPSHLPAAADADADQ